MCLLDWLDWNLEAAVSVLSVRSKTSQSWLETCGLRLKPASLESAQILAQKVQSTKVAQIEWKEAESGQ